jgi:competence protein ComEA
MRAGNVSALAVGLVRISRRANCFWFSMLPATNAYAAPLELGGQYGRRRQEPLRGETAKTHFRTHQMPCRKSDTDRISVRWRASRAFLPPAFCELQLKKSKIQKAITMTEITPLSSTQRPPESQPDRTFGDTLDTQQESKARFTPLHGVLFLLGVWAIFSLGAWSQNRAPHPPPTGYYQSASTQTPGRIIVHVAGAVKKAGVYQLPPEARVSDAVKRAVPLPDADINALNLAAWAEDGSRIEVPFRERNDAPRDEPLITKSTPPIEKIAAQPTPQIAPTAKPTSQRKSTPARKININKASLDELTELPGIGPATAQRIVDYRRENGVFSSVDELDEVKGIGPKKLDNLRPYATVK